MSQNERCGETNMTLKETSIRANWCNDAGLDRSIIAHRKPHHRRETF
ncbi:MAG: hypothetical protein QXU32_12260 [Nitrososphaerales archaeon]